MKILLLLLTFFTGFTALVSGALLVADTSGNLIGLPADLLDPTPFRNFLIPGLLLAIFVGVFNMLGGFMLASERKQSYNWTIMGGLVVVVWVIVQVVLIETIFWLQFVYLGIGLSMVLLSYQLKNKWIV